MSIKSLLVDPFEGFFGAQPAHAHRSPALLDFPIAQRWMSNLDWTMRNGLYTFQQPLNGQSGARVLRGRRECLMLSSYDYLGLIGHPAIEAAAVEAIRRFGTATGGVRMLTGSTRLHQQIEGELARFVGTEAAITFSSGYSANVGAICALLGPGDVVFADAAAHRSIIDGCRLSGASLFTFPHNNAARLDKSITKLGRRSRVLIVVEGVYSMDGDICPLPDFLAVKEKHGASIMVDEAHSLGVLGPTGRGITEYFGIPAGIVDLVTGSLSKAIPATGGFVAGSRELTIFLAHAAGPFFFSAALAPASAAAALASIDVILAEPGRIAQAWRNAEQLRNGLCDLGFDTGGSSGPLLPIIVGGEEVALSLARDLLKYDIVTSAVIPPAVPRGKARLRLCISAAHQPGDIRDALAAFERLR